MNLPNKTKNQHFVSQAEQRLNALNPDAKPKKQRICAFAIAEREIPVLYLQRPDGVSISETLALSDLFSFDVVDDVHRHNLESEFQEYERDIAQHSRTLLQKLASDDSTNIKAELLGLFAAKFLTFLRNPYSVAKVLNTVGTAADYQPTDARLIALYHRVLDGSKLHQARLTSTLGITPDAYARWLRALFMLLHRVEDQEHNIFERVIAGLFNSHYVAVQIYHYPGADECQVCLLSDRGFSIPLESSALFSFDVNVSKKAFARFVFCDVAKFTQAPAPLADRLNGQVVVQYIIDDLGALSWYNKNTAYQCFEHVYAASPSPWGCECVVVP
jgi:hypothetical protein